MTANGGGVFLITEVRWHGFTARSYHVPQCSWFARLSSYQWIFVKRVLYRVYSKKLPFILFCIEYAGSPKFYRGTGTRDLWTTSPTTSRSCSSGSSESRSAVLCFIRWRFINIAVLQFWNLDVSQSIIVKNSVFNHHPFNVCFFLQD